MKKREFFKILRLHLSERELREKVREADEMWRAAAISVVTFYKYYFPHEIYKELLRYLFKARCKFDLKFRERFGYYPSDEKLWGVNRLILKNGIPVNFL